MEGDVLVKYIASDTLFYIILIGTINNVIFNARARSANIQYNLPANDTEDGPFYGVFVSCSSSVYSVNSSSSHSSSLEVNITSLSPFTNYTCCATPQWINNNNGRDVCSNITTLQDSQFHITVL